MKEIEILKLVKDVLGECCIHIDEVGWQISEELEELILKELKSHLGGDFKEEFDPMINRAIKRIESCQSLE